MVDKLDKHISLESLFPFILIQAMEKRFSSSLSTPFILTQAMEKYTFLWKNQGHLDGPSD